LSARIHWPAVAFGGFDARAEVDAEDIGEGADAEGAGVVLVGGQLSIWMRSMVKMTFGSLPKVSRVQPSMIPSVVRSGFQTSLP
jgi:hypothetical protein